MELAAFGSAVNVTFKEPAPVSPEIVGVVGVDRVVWCALAEPAADSIDAVYPADASAVIVT